MSRSQIVSCEYSLSTYMGILMRIGRREGGIEGVWPAEASRRLKKKVGGEGEESLLSQDQEILKRYLMFLRV